MPPSTPPSTDPRVLLARALDQTAEVIAGVRADQTELPTPCRSWTVAALLDHVVHDLGPSTVAANGGEPDWSAPAAPAGPDWLGAFRKGSAELREAWSKAGDLSGTVELPGMGEVPARLPVDMQIAEFAAHAWDLARATGQEVAFDEEVGETALAFTRSALSPEFRGEESEGKAFGPVTECPPDAPLYDRLAAFLGRQPV